MGFLFVIKHGNQIHLVQTDTQNSSSIESQVRKRVLRKDQQMKRTRRTRKA